MHFPPGVLTPTNGAATNGLEYLTLVRDGSLNPLVADSSGGCLSQRSEARLRTLFGGSLAEDEASLSRS
jgi:hypothetical protein